MSRSAWGFSVFVAVLAAFLLVPTLLRAEITADHRKQLAEIKKEMGKLAGLIAKKEIAEAERLLGELETKLKQLCTDAGIQETDKFAAGVFKQIELKRTALAKKTGGNTGGVTFEKDVAPVLAANCVRCHGGDNPRGQLNMTTFAGIVAGGADGPIIAVGNVAGSALVRRISSTGRDRMPPPGNNNAPGLKPDEIKAITAWVQQGAKFSGDNNTPIRDLANSTGSKPMPAAAIEIPKPTGNETVSFTKDIAPFMSRLCVNCHRGQNARSGFSLETFELLMKGGNSGRVLLPGNSKDSRLWHLAGEQDPIKMPPGQALITKTNHANLKIWIDEGCKFDGDDPKAPLVSLVASAGEQRLKELAARSPADWEKARRDDVGALWKAATKDEMKSLETTNFLVAGDVPESRLKQVGEWAEESAKSLARLLEIKETPQWKGRLAVFVFKERFGFAEFTQTNDGREAASGQFGYAKVNPGQERAYVAVQDVGDSPADGTGGLRALVSENVAQAAILRSGRRTPEWMGRGLGLVLASKSEPKNPYFKGLPAAAWEEIKVLENPIDVFQDGTFAQDDHAAVSYTLVSYMMSQGEQQFAQFLKSMMSGTPFEASLKSVYSADSQNLYNSLRSTLSSSKKK